MEIRVPITQKQHGMLSELRRAVMELAQREQVALATLVAGADEELPANAQYVGADAKDGVFSLLFVVPDIAPEKPRNNRKSSSSQE